MVYCITEHGIAFLIVGGWFWDFFTQDTRIVVLCYLLNIAYLFCGALSGSLFSRRTASVSFYKSGRMLIGRYIIFLFSL